MKFKIKKDNENCEIDMKETDEGLKIETKGNGCKKILGKDYFKEMEFKGDEL